MVRDQFATRTGFILACVGSAVGMANIWLFPIRVGEFGGAAFLIPYFLFIVIIGLTGVIGEMSFGRAMKTGPLGAFRKAMERRGYSWGEYIGIIPVIGSLAIAIGYAVVIAWILKFAVGSLSGAIFEAQSTGAYFGAIAGKFGSLGWHITVLVATFVIMSAGIAKGIEKVNKVLMPIFFLLFLILAVRVAFLGGDVMKGYVYLFKPKWEYLSNVKTWVYALGQAFFSLSLAGSGTVVYGSYLSKEEDVVASAKNVAIFDTIAAMLAALVIIPAVFAFGIAPNAGPPLMFITMPEVFKLMPAGGLFMSIFFIAVLFAGITSLVNLFEAPIEALQEKFHFSRPLAVGTVILIAVAVGVFLEDGNMLGMWMDVVSIYIIPLGALLSGIMFFWVCGFPFAKEQAELGRKKPLPNTFLPLSKYLFCGLTILVYILSIFYGGIG